ncbi:MAG: sensor histidine kinase [Bacteroidia bacterium]|nr:sensor histidine kinase [Bacteroidia bacterium]
MKNRGLEIVIHLLFWYITAWLIVSGFSIHSQEIELINGEETIHIVRDRGSAIQLLTCIFFSAGMFYAVVYQLQKLEKLSIQNAFRVVCIFLLSFAGYFVMARLNRISGGPLLPAGLWLGVSLFYFMAAIAYSLFKIWKHSEEQRQQVLLQKNTAELALLRSQLHPHFLFNVLNNLLSMVDQKNNPALASAIDKLSFLLRYVVDETSQPKVPIRKEILFIQSFADLNALRFDKDELTFILEVEGANDQQLIEPGIFIPFLENAFKYGIEPEKHSTLRLKINITEPDEVYFELKNPLYPAMQKNSSNGSGIRSVTERLRIVYPGQHTFKVEERDGLFTVKLQIRTHESDYR